MVNVNQTRLSLSVHYILSDLQYAVCTHDTRDKISANLRPHVYVIKQQARSDKLDLTIKNLNRKQ